ncbi:hypothetical protein, partial [Klebsiella pneumoniae]|uniref:hypothetical protein n=1 Tax=Klebsiella pneumoniae TaxID=573 RepID=UPI00272FFB1C
FPEHIRHGTTQNAILEAGLALLLSVQEQQPDKDLQTAAVDDAIERNISALDAREFPGGLNSEDIDAVMATIGSRVEETLPLYIS